ncbi:carbohydrate deacetylase [Paenibacillus mesophilus]|uniref:carbohydrate deacetylase n=1 Tax=Paenibacillus mesophilus TaxID=2582849 RepID=UPI0013052905|nr:ChbG/HpnK family deacetylase [Paenibacillus mesophilus]
MSKYVIVNADDFGLSKHINEAILEAHRNGIVTSTTLMANMPGFNHAVLSAKRNRSLGVGLHANLSYGKPLSPAASVPSLVGADGFFSDKRDGWRVQDIERELYRQFDMLVSAGLQPTHLDSHHHIHLEVSSVYSIMCKLAEQKRIPIRLHPWSSQLECRPASTDRLIMDTYEQSDGAERLLAHMESMADGTTEIMCHPVYGGGELRSLTDPRIKEAILRHSIRLIDYRLLPALHSVPVGTEADLLEATIPHPTDPIAPAKYRPRRNKPRARKSYSGKTKSASVRKKRSSRAISGRTSRTRIAKRRWKTKPR